MALQWLTLIASIWLQSINGTNSNFPAYSSQLKRILSTSQLKLNNLASANDAGKLFGWISGVAASHLPLWLVLLIGSLLGLIGYGVQFLVLTHQAPSLSYWHVFFLTALAGNGICWINTVCYIISIRNFPYDRQIAVGLSTSYVGLSAKIYTDIVDVAAPTSPSERAKVFLLLNSVLPLLVCIVVSPLARDVNVGKSKELRRGFFTMFIISIVAGLFAVMTSLRAVAVPSYVTLAGMVVVLSLPLIVPVAEKVREAVQQKCLIAAVHDVGSFDEKAPPENSKDVESGRNVVEVGAAEEVGPLLMLRRLEFWVYFLVYLFGATLGLVYMNNLAQIAESRGCSGTSSLVSLSSAFSFFGRLLPSFLDYFFPRSKRVVTRAAATGAMMGPMCGAFFLLVDRRESSLYVGTAIIGITTGAITSLSVATTAELFGAKNFGVNHNILVSNIPIGSFLFGDFAALFYNAHTNEDEGDVCRGHNCYQTTFILWGSLSLCGTFLAFILHLQTKKLWSHKTSTTHMHPTHNSSSLTIN